MLEYILTITNISIIYYHFLKPIIINYIIDSILKSMLLLTNFNITMLCFKKLFS